ncbi:MAG: MarR family transcriptional regulator [Epsilonproteobacteria bacterium]|nr:MarR family transcriptional regulator [Campylobacterota bacterium]
MSSIANKIIPQLKLTKNFIENEHNKYLKPYGISNEQGFLLKYVYEMPGLTQTELSQYLHKDKTTITRMIDALVKKRKIVRKTSLEDRRVSKIFLTEETKENAKKLSPIFEKQEEELKVIIGADDYETTLKVLEKIKKYYEGLNK